MRPEGAEIEAEQVFGETVGRGDALYYGKGPAGAINLEYRHAHGTTIYGGSSEVHRSMVAEKGLGLPRSRQ